MLQIRVIQASEMVWTTSGRTPKGMGSTVVGRLQKTVQVTGCESLCPSQRHLGCKERERALARMDSCQEATIVPSQVSNE